MPISGHSGVQHPVGIPKGGDTDEVLTKQSPRSYDVDWDPGGGGGGVTPAELAAAVNQAMGAALALAADGGGGDPVLVPGAAGSRGPKGSQGPPGPALFLLQDDLELPLMIPGPRGPVGPQGPSGGGGSGGSVTIVFDDGYEAELPWPSRNGVAVLNQRFQRFNAPQVIKTDVDSANPEKYEQLHLENYDDVTLGIMFRDLRAGVDTQRGTIIQAFGVFGLVVFNDDKSIQRNAVLIDRLAASGVAIQRQRYGNTTDHPIHQINGGIQQSTVYGTTNPLMTIAADTTLSYTKTMYVPGTNRVTMVGNSRLRVRN